MPLSQWSLGGFYLHRHFDFGSHVNQNLAEKKILYAYCALTILCCVLILFLFIFLSVLLDYEDSWLRDSWDHTHQVFVRYLNRVIESTKIAMYTLQLLLACAYEICCVASLVLIARNIWWVTPPETVRAYYVQESPMGHQTLLVPLDLTNAPPTAEEINLMQMADKISIATQTAPLQDALSSL